MKPAIYNFEIEQGVDLYLPLVWATRAAGVDTPVNLTGYTARLQLVTDSGEVIDWSSEGASPVITFDVLLGKAIINVSSAVTGALDFIFAHYEFELTSPAGRVYRMLRGEVKLNKELKTNA